MKYRTTFKCANDAWDYGLGLEYAEQGGNWEFELDKTYDEGDEWGVVHEGTDGFIYPEKFVEKVE